MLHYRLAFPILIFLLNETSGLKDDPNALNFPIHSSLISTTGVSDCPLQDASFAGAGNDTAASVCYTDGECPATVAARRPAEQEDTFSTNFMARINNLVESLVSGSPFSTPVMSSIYATAAHDLTVPFIGAQPLFEESRVSSRLSSNRASMLMFASFPSTSEQYMASSLQTGVFATPVMTAYSKISRQRTDRICSSTGSSFPSATLSPSRDGYCEGRAAVQFHLISKLKTLIKKIKKLVMEYRRATLKIIKLARRGRAFRRIGEEGALSERVTSVPGRVTPIQSSVILSETLTQAQAQTERRSLGIHGSRSVLRLAQGLMNEMQCDPVFPYPIQTINDVMGEMDNLSLLRPRDESMYLSWVSLPKVNLKIV